MKTLFAAALAVTLLTGNAVAEEATDPAYEFILAKLAAAEGRFDDALARMDRILAANPNDAVVMFEHATILADAGRFDRAETELRRVVRTKPDFFDAHRLLGRILLERAGNDRDKVDEAVGFLRNAFKLNPDDLSNGMALAQILMSLGKMDEAEKILAQMLERSPDQRALNYAYAGVLTKLGRGDESRQYLERAVQVDPTFGPAILQLVDIYQKQNEWAKAADLLQPLIDEDPANIDVQKQQAFFFLRAGLAEKARDAFKAIIAADPRDTRARYYLAESLTDLQQHDEAQAIYRKLLEAEPRDPDLLASFGISLVAQRKFEEAAKNFQLLATTPGVADNFKALATTQLAYIELESGRYDEAIRMAKAVLVFNDAPNPQAINIGLDALKKQRKYAEAIEMLRPLESRYGTDPYVGARMVEMLVRSGDAAKARQLAEAHVKMGVRNAIATGDAYIQAGDPKSAVALLSSALTAKPAELDLQFAFGAANERAGDIPSAEKAFLKILDSHPDHSPTLNYLGYMWAERGVNLKRATDMLLKAVAAEPRNGAYVDSLGWVYFQQGDLELAELHLRDASKLLPRDATVQEHLGDVLARRGDIVRALNAYRAALKLEPEAKDEAKLKSKIAELERQAQNAQR